MTPRQMADEAARIYQQVTQARWPDSEQAVTSIRWTVSYYLDAVKERDAILNGDMDPYHLRDPDMGWWDDPEAAADWVTADRVLEAARAMDRRLAKYQPRDEAVKEERAA
jgi:hypothetical protein